MTLNTAIAPVPSDRPVLPARRDLAGLLRDLDLIPRRRRPAGPAGPARPAVPYPHGRVDQAIILMGWLMTRLRAGWSPARVRQGAATWLPGAVGIVKAVLSALREWRRDDDPGPGVVEYSKRVRDGFFLVAFRRNPNGTEHFSNLEAGEVRWHDHQPTAAERDVARLLLRLGWGGPRIVMDDFLAVLGDWKAPPAGRPAADPELARLYDLVDGHRGLAGRLVRHHGLGVSADDLLQEVRLRLWRGWNKGCRLTEGEAAVGYVQKCLRNLARSLTACRRARPFGAVGMDGRLEDRRAWRSAEAERAARIIERVSLGLGPNGKFALACALGQDDLDSYAARTRRCRATARRHWMAGVTELARRIREVEAADDE